MHGDPQKVLGVGRRPTVEREGDLAAYTAQAAANAIRLILVTLHDIALDGLIFAEGIATSGMSRSSTERNCASSTAENGWSARITHSTKRFLSSSSENLVLVLVAGSVDLKGQDWMSV